MSLLRLSRRVWPRLLAAIGALGFAALAADLVYHGALTRWDVPLAAWVHPRVPEQMVWLCSFVTAFGALPLIVAATLVVGMLLGVFRRWAELAMLLTGLMGSAVLTGYFKHMLARTRPAEHTFFAPGAGYSFPSGHTMGAVVFWGLAALLLLRVARGRGLRRAVGIAGLAVPALVGVGLWLIGVHYLTDVLAAWALGAGWVGLCAAVLEVISPVGECSAGSGAIPADRG